MEYFEYSDIKEEIKLIEGTENYFVGNCGNIYIKKDNKFYKKKNYINPHNFYAYCGIKYKGNINLTKVRVHRLVAIAFIDNPNNYNIVGHKDNNKSNNIYTNLYWTTISENTKKAYDDGLAKNDKGYEDSQSFPVCVFDMDKKLIKEYGSMSIAAKELKVSKSTVSRQCQHQIYTKPRCGYYFRYKEEYYKEGFVL